MARWDDKAANTFNKHPSALNSFAAYARRQEWLTTNPGRRLERRKVTRARDKAIPRARLERLFTDDRHPLRERVLWRMLYRPGPTVLPALRVPVQAGVPAARPARRRGTYSTSCVTAG